MTKLFLAGRGSPPAMYNASFKNGAAYLLPAYVLAAKRAYLLTILLNGGMRNV
jgi:hypothetical protein